MCRFKKRKEKGSWKKICLCIKSEYFSKEAFCSRCPFERLNQLPILRG